MIPIAVAILGLSLPLFADDAGTLEAAVEVVEDRFGDKVDSRQLYRAAVAGMAVHLDEMLGTEGNALLTSQEAAEEQADRRGERYGIGVEFSVISQRGVVLTDVYPGGPGERAGLRPGDFVVGVNGQPLTGMPGRVLHETLTHIVGGKVTLDFRRDDAELRRISVDRGRYRVGGVRLVPQEAPDITLVRVPFFGQGSAAALAALLKGADEHDALILDLRHTEGGLLTEAVAAAELFLEPGSIVVKELDPSGDTRSTVAKGPQLWPGRVVVIVDRETAGPAEAFLMALHDNRRGRIVGTRTAGQASLTALHPISRDLVLRLAETTLLGPSGRSWGGAGVIPDIVVEPLDLVFPARPGQVPPDLQREAALQLTLNPGGMPR